MTTNQMILVEAFLFSSGIYYAIVCGNRLLKTLQSKYYDYMHRDEYAAAAQRVMKEAEAEYIAKYGIPEEPIQALIHD